MFPRIVPNALFGLGLICFASDRASAQDHVAIKNGLWHLTKVNKFDSSSRTDEFRLCVGDGGAYVPFLIAAGNKLFNRDADVSVEVYQGNTQRVRVNTMHTLFDVRMKFDSPDKGTGEGTQSQPQERWAVHMTWEYEGESCQGIWPGHSRAKLLGEWQ